MVRTYEVKVRDQFSGLEKDAIKLLRGEIKPTLRNTIPMPTFEVLNEKEKIARYVLF